MLYFVAGRTSAAADAPGMLARVQGCLEYDTGWLPVASRTITWQGGPFFFVGASFAGDMGGTAKILPGGNGIAAHIGYLTPARSEQDRAGSYLRLAVDEHRLRITNTFARTEVCYLAESTEGAFVGNRAGTLARICHHGDAPLDIAAMVGLVSAGFVLGEDTIYRGVRLLPPKVDLEITAEHVRARRDELLDAVDDRPLRVLARECAEALCRHVEVLRGKEDSVSLGLTGGKDSRLIAGALAATGLRIVTHTAGTPTDGDCVVAARIARTLGLPHTIQPRAPSSGEIPKIDLNDKCMWALRLGEGMHNMYETLALPRRQPRLSIGGQGGELMRGGFGRYRREDSDLAEIIERLKGFAPLRNRALLTESGAQLMERSFERWIEASGSGLQGPASVYDRYYLEYRVGRWLAHARHAGPGSLRIIPFLDDQLLARVFRVPRPARTSERLIFAILERLTPRLVQIPFKGDRWRFASRRPSWLQPLQRIRWDRRAPVLDGGPRNAPGPTWRNGYDTHLRGPMRDLILDRCCDPLFEFIDRRVVEEWLSDPGPTPSIRVNSVMGLATAAWTLHQKQDPVATRDSLRVELDSYEGP